MTQTNKYRGKYIKTGEWVYGDVLHAQNYDPNTQTSTKSENLLIVTGEVGERSYVADIIPNTLGQFTDLHDKQGNEIYQGDILRWATLVGVVTWHPYGYWCIHTDDDDISNHTYITIGEAIKIAKNENYDFKVIGNIHDNPIKDYPAG